MVYHRFSNPTPKIGRPNHTIKNETGYILNLACFKATGSYLPSSFYTQDWYYEIDDKGRRRARYKPSSIPSIISNPTQPYHPDGIEQHIKRTAIVSELNEAFKPTNLDKDCVIYVLLPFAAHIRDIHEEKQSHEALRYNLNTPEQLLYIPETDIIMSGYNGLLDPAIPQAIYNSADIMYKQTNGFYNYRDLISGWRHKENSLCPLINKLIKSSNFKGNTHYYPKADLKKKETRYDIMRNLKIYNILNTLIHNINTTDTIPLKDKKLTVKEYLMDWMNKMYPLQEANRDCKISKILRHRTKDITSCVDNQYDDNYKHDKPTGYEATNIIICSNPNRSTDSPSTACYIRATHNELGWFDKIKGLNTTSKGYHAQHHLLTKDYNLPVKQACWTPAFWMCNKGRRDNIGPQLYALGEHYGLMAQRRDKIKVWDKVKKESALLSQVQPSNGYEIRFLENIMKIVSNH